MKFPGTKEEFDAWWEGKEDGRWKGVRSHTCPIARFLRHKGVVNASVGCLMWSGNGVLLNILPRWAKEYVYVFDNEFYLPIAF